ncbi:hypothetical protein fugu_011213 [Takifugu bimaculatus]|uniref:Guanylate cyclase n=1 Tax=Takifugu bimaculatus TaxID=433685 RepID=A0A4Z2CCG4_9TELE|nr:hypothetical protein fugu_011213 [Takifugu bimaculatus]
MEQETSGWPNCNQVLITNLAAAESRCAKLERQLDVTRRLLASQGSKETTKAADGQSKVVPEPAQSEKVKRLEQDYHRLTRTQSYNEMKIRQLEMKLQEEEHQRKLVQDKTSQLQSDLEANRILLQSVSPHLARRRSKEKPHPVKHLPERSSRTEPHYRLSLRDVPFVAGTSAGCSHSVRANVQSVLSLLKRHQPHLCNRRVLSTEAKNQETGSHKRSDASSPASPSAAGEEELSELLRALQEEMRLMSLEQDELMRQQEASVSEEERRGVQREQERLLYGFINTCLKSMVVETFGEETWLKLREEAGVQDSFLTYEVYEDDITMQLVADACKLLGVEPQVVLRQFGEYFFKFCKSSGYDHMLRTLGGNLCEFTENLDALHSFLSLSYKEMNAPSFRVERDPDGALLLHYYSDRRGLCQIVPGIIAAVAKDFFDSDVTMEVVDQLEELERTGKKEHVVFLVSEQPRARASKGPITETPRSPVARRDAEVTEMSTLFSLHLQAAQPEKTTVSKGRGNWEVIRGLVQLGKGKLLRDFQPVYPEALNVDLETFCNAFPFHIVFDEQVQQFRGTHV